MARQQDGELSDTHEDIDDEEYKHIIKSAAYSVDHELHEDVYHNDWIISYYSMNSLRFEFLTCILVFYDCFMVPFKYTFGGNFFDERTALILDVIDYSIKFVFAIDVILGFRKAYLKEKSG